MTLTKPFAYIDSKGQRWEAPAGSRVNGASIPKFAWPAVGGPFVGAYRDASVIHDVACDQQTREWKETHRVFYEAMRKSGVSKLKAKIMYAAVYHFGPRWEKLLPGEVDPTLGSSGLGISSSIDLSETPTDFDVLEWRIERDDISLDAIEEFNCFDFDRDQTIPSDCTNTLQF